MMKIFILQANLCYILLQILQDILKIIAAVYHRAGSRINPGQLTTFNQSHAVIYTNYRIIPINRPPPNKRPPIFATMLKLKMSTTKDPNV